MTKAMVLAAGVGSRLEPISSQLPKPLVPVLNVPVICHVFYLLQKHGIVDVIANTHYLAEKISGYFKINAIDGFNLNFRFEPELTGDAGGVRACREFLDGDTFFVLMGDLLTNADLSRLLEAHRRKKAIATIGLKTVKDVSKFGVMLRDEDGYIKAFQEKPQPQEAISSEISTGIYILEPEIFQYIPAGGVYGFGRQLFPHLLELGLPILGEPLDGYWSDIGTLASLHQANMDALAGRVSLTEQALIQSDFKKSADNVLLGKNVDIAATAALGHNTIVGDNCRIGDGVKTENCLIFPDSTVEAAACLKDCIFAFGREVPVLAQAK